MVLDVVQLLALVVLVAGIWVGMLASGPIGVAMILTALVVIAVALWVEHNLENTR
jgi:hypothetical protein